MEVKRRPTNAPYNTLKVRLGGAVKGSVSITKAKKRNEEYWNVCASMAIGLPWEVRTIVSSTTTKKRKDEIKSADFAHNEQSAKEHKREEHQISIDPPRCRLTKNKRRERNAKGRGIENMFSADSENIFRCHCSRRYKNEKTNTRIIVEGSGGEYERENKSGDIH